MPQYADLIKSVKIAVAFMTSLVTNSSLRPPVSPVRGRIWLRTLITAAFLLSMVRAVHAQAFRIDGTVRDSSGALISGAQVDLHAGSYTASTTTDSSGEFAFDHVPAGSGTVIVNARGFDPVEKAWTAATNDLARLEIILAPSAVNQSVIVTATRSQTLLSDVPLSDIQLTRVDVQAIPALTLDETLRQVPGFSLFRRSSSRTANPTTQGVSLRGLGASGSSRALVLSDGFPLNDPFGGWVYWDRAPRESIGSIEVASGGASHLYGSDALGGVINIIRAPVDRNQ